MSVGVYKFLLGTDAVLASKKNYPTLVMTEILALFVKRMEKTGSVCSLPPIIQVFAHFVHHLCVCAACLGI